jgi:hypothetical protein
MLYWHMYARKIVVESRDRNVWMPGIEQDYFMLVYANTGCHYFDITCTCSRKKKFYKVWLYVSKH